MIETQFYRAPSALDALFVAHALTPREDHAPGVRQTKAKGVHQR